MIIIRLRGNLLTDDKKLIVLSLDFISKICTKPICKHFSKINSCSTRWSSFILKSQRIRYLLGAIKAALINDQWVESLKKQQQKFSYKINCN